MEQEIKIKSLYGNPAKNIKCTPVAPQKKVQKSSEHLNL